MSQNSIRKLFVVFAALYFIQGTGELTAGLLGTPLRSMLRDWGNDAGQIAAYMFIIGLPWYIKPLFGLITDFLPIRGYRRKSYLILASSLMILGYISTLFLPLEQAFTTIMIAVLVLPSLGIAFKDVATDAAMVEAGQPLGITGRLQSAQWGAIYAAGLICGVAGGWIAQNGYQRLGFLIGALLGLAALYIAIFQIPEEPNLEYQRGKLRRALAVLGKAARSRIVLMVAAFIFLINFNPFSADVLFIHMTTVLGFSDQFYGTTLTVSSFASMVACLIYGLYAKRIPLRWLLHGSVFFMVISTLVYIGLGSETSAIIISLAWGFVYMVTSLAQLELAGRYCPPEAAGTVFALLMAVWNLSISTSGIVGGRLYESWTDAWGVDTAYMALVAIGASITALGWLLMRFFPKSMMADEK
jgi:MFS family permease